MAALDDKLSKAAERTYGSEDAEVIDNVAVSWKCNRTFEAMSGGNPKYLRMSKVGTEESYVIHGKPCRSLGVRE